MSLRDNPCKSKSLTSQEQTRAKTGKTLQQPNNKLANMVLDGDAKQIFYIEDQLFFVSFQKSSSPVNPPPPHIRLVLSTLCMYASVV
jgi:hypothetical protein